MFGMLGGQSVGRPRKPESLDAATLDFIYRLKTGALLEAAFMMGAALGGGATEEELRLAEQIGAAVGLAFQIRDDILDRRHDGRRNSENRCTRTKRIRRRPMSPCTAWRARKRRSEQQSEIAAQR